LQDRKMEIPPSLQSQLHSCALIGTCKSFSEALILASTNPQYDNRLWVN
jgi:hypothetical protein